MKSFVATVLCVAIATANASIYGGIGLVGPAAPGVVLQGPSARAALVGPDGSHVAGAALGGAVVAAPRPGGAVAAAVSPGAIGIGHGLGLAGPALVAPGLIGGGYGLGLGAGILAPGSGLEGQWVPDNTELLYDDGSYRGEHAYGHGW